ncbi:MAG TPA: hypothetical protein VGD59_11055 [Acidisarcina sp.]
MTLANLTSRAGNSIQDAIGDLNIKEMHWTRAVAAGSLLTSVCLLVAGKRKAALAIAAAGTAVALLEDPDELRGFWEKLPDYVESGQKFLTRLEGFVEELGTQGERLRSTLGRVQG